MPDSESVLLAELELLAPADDVPAPRWGDVRRRARPPGLRKRRVAIALAFATAVAVLASAFALSARLRSLVGIEPDRSRATLQLQIPVPDSSLVFRIFTSPEKHRLGGCIWAGFALADVPPPQSPLPGYSCTIRGPLLPRGLFVTPDIQGRVPYHRPRFPNAVIWGWVKGVRAYRLALVWHGGSERLAGKNGFFAAAPAILYRPPRRDLPFAVVAYDIHGREVARHAIPSRQLYP